MAENQRQSDEAMLYDALVLSKLFIAERQAEKSSSRL